MSLLVGLTTFEPAIFAYSSATASFSATDATVQPQSASPTSTTYSDAAEHGTPSSDGRAEQLLHPTKTVARGDESSDSIPTAGTAVLRSTTIARFTVTPVHEQDGDPEPPSEDISETRKEELFLINKLSKIKLHELSLSEEENVNQLATSSPALPACQTNQSVESTLSETTSCSSSVSNGSGMTSHRPEQSNIISNDQGCLASLILQVSSNGSSMTTTSSSISSSSCTNNSSVEYHVSSTIKLYRKHRVSSQYPEYNV